MINTKYLTAESVVSALCSAADANEAAARGMDSEAFFAGVAAVLNVADSAPTIPAVMLPCNVGDVVYMILFDYEPYPHRWIVPRVITKDSTIGFLTGDSWGKTVFLTREAAEAALRRAEV